MNDTGSKLISGVRRKGFSLNNYYLVTFDYWTIVLNVCPCRVRLLESVKNLV